jgi:hypothetical protein
VNGAQPINIAFTPQSFGTFTGTLTFSTNSSGTQPVVAFNGVGGSASAHSAIVSWTPSTSTVVGYNVYRSTTPGGLYTKLNGILLTQPTFADTALVSGKTYYWVVTAVDPNGNESGFSNEATATIP